MPDLRQLLGDIEQGIAMSQVFQHGNQRLDIHFGVLILGHARGRPFMISAVELPTVS